MLINRRVLNVLAQDRWGGDSDRHLMTKSCEEGAARELPKSCLAVFDSQRLLDFAGLLGSVLKGRSTR